jgi:hypothetical protein
MTTYTVTMTRSPDLTDDQVRQKLHSVYSLLIRLGEEHKRADDCEGLDSKTRIEATEVPEQHLGTAEEGDDD